jgi:hypothetical protein
LHDLRPGGRVGDETTEPESKSSPDMKFISATRPSLFLTVLGLFLPICSFAQSASAQTEPAAATAPAASPASGIKLYPFSLEIRNGAIVEDGRPTDQATVRNVLQYMQDRNISSSISLGPSVSEYVLCDMALHLSASRPFTIWSVIRSIDSSLELTQIDGGNGSPNIILSLSGRPLLGVAVFNLSGYLSLCVNLSGIADPKAVNEKMTQLIDIINTTLYSLVPNLPSNAKPQFEFHEGADLLVVTGTNQALDVATKVVNALIGSGQVANASSMISPSPDPKPAPAPPLAT